ncbi:MAG: trehalose 6-phosphate synthase/phosphatase [Ilumatobacteraceae bacterium]|jgi:alpha,alpha-trehalose-phosphate synthase [UDP-forming]
MKGLVVAANRLPVEVTADGHLRTSPGGLASALSSVTAAGTQWVGWAGPESGRPKQFDHGDLRLHPVALSEDEVDRYYRGFSNEILWPLFHGRLRRVELNRAWWHSYRIVNRRFAAAVTRIAPLGGTVWVHDYHLLLVPEMIRSKRPDLHIGLFLHIPFPNAQLFSMLPWRKEVLKGMLGADVLGFQVAEDVENFVAAADRLVHSRTRGNMLFDGGHVVDVDAFPISIDFDHWNALGEAAGAGAAQHRSELGVEFIFLGIDRLDYTKGISQRLRAFGELLDEGRLDPEKCAFVQVAVPSRTEVSAYEDEREEVETLIERINTKHARMDGSQPVLYMDTSLDEAEMAAWFRAANAMVVTSLADGMNLVAKEFVASRGDLGGSLVLSEFAGAAQDLDGAIIVNPYDIEAIKRAYVSAIEMPAAERAARLKTMRTAVHHNDVHRWARHFLNRLHSSARVRSTDLATRPDAASAVGSDTVRNLR